MFPIRRGQPLSRHVSHARGDPDITVLFQARARKRPESAHQEMAWRIPFEYPQHDFMNVVELVTVGSYAYSAQSVHYFRQISDKSLIQSTRLFFS